MKQQHLKSLRSAIFCVLWCRERVWGAFDTSPLVVVGAAVPSEASCRFGLLVNKSLKAHDVRKRLYSVVAAAVRGACVHHVADLRLRLVVRGFMLIQSGPGHCFDR